MKIKESEETSSSGLMFTVVGIAFAWGATTYNVGSGARMGPGYFPLMLGIVLAVIGAVHHVHRRWSVETEDGEKIGKWAWKQLFFIIGANLAFGVLLGGLPSIGVPAMGMIIAIYALIFIAEPGRRRIQAARTSLILGDRAGRRQLHRLHLGAEAADPGVAHLHHAAEDEHRTWT